VDTKPQLEIFNNDVKCTHGSTIGQLDESMLFYLRSRGLPRDEARMLLTQGFANEVVQRVKIASLRSRLDGWLSEKLQGTS
jgi:Fe-S cluster assembly protein SufD